MIYDELLIGSGLSAYSYLLGLASKNEIKKIICLSTDKIPSQESSVHIKLCDGSFKIIDNESNNFYGPTSALGGLSNAWGGVLYKPNVNYRESRSQEIIDEAAKHILDELSNKFNVYQKLDDKWTPYLSSEFNGCVNFYIVTGNKKYGWEKSGTNVYPVFKELLERLSIKMQVQKVIGLSFEENEKLWTIHTNERSFKSKKVILAAGGLGSLKLLNTFSTDRYSIMDHNPYQFICIKLPFFKINAIAKEYTPIRDVTHFGSDVVAVYSLSDLSNSFLLRMIPKWFPFKDIFVNLIKSIIFIQYWTNETVVNLHVEKIKKYNFINLFKNILKILKYGVLPIYLKKTRSGEGFHYANAFNIGNGSPVGNSYSQHGLIIIGGAALTEIKPEHPTFSFMIDSYIKGKYNA